MYVLAFNDENTKILKNVYKGDIKNCQKWFCVNLSYVCNSFISGIYVTDDDEDK